MKRPSQAVVHRAWLAAVLLTTFLSIVFPLRSRIRRRRYGSAGRADWRSPRPRSWWLADLLFLAGFATLLAGAALEGLDYVTPDHLKEVFLAGLRHRDATGNGIELRVPLGDVAIGTMANAGAMAEMLYRGGDRERLGNAIWGAFGRDFVSRDGKRFMVAALTPKQWKATVEAFGLTAEVAALEAQLGVSFLASDHQRFVNRLQLFDLFQHAASQFDYTDLAARLAKAGATFERYRTMFEAANDPELVTGNPLFGPSPANPSGFSYPATRSFANIPEKQVGDPKAAPYLGEHSEEVLAERLGLSSGQIATLIDRGVVSISDKDSK